MIKIYITPLINKAGRYSVENEEGDLLIESTRVPFFDGARALAGQGLTGPFEMWDRVRPYARMRGDIAKAARLTVSENDKGLRLETWKPFPVSAVAPKDGDEEA